MRFVREPLGEAEAGVYPLAGVTRDGLVVAWTGTAAGGSLVRVERR